MTFTLLIRLAGPLQAWGTASRFMHRDTDPERPTKSGVIGLLAAADGHHRDAHDTDYPDALPLAVLAELRFGVRADRPGVLIRDYHVVGGGRFPVRPRDLIVDPKRAEAAERKPVENVEGAFGTVELSSWYGAPKGIHRDESGRLQAGVTTKRMPLITNRWYLSDAAFVAAVESGDRGLLEHLANRLDRPRRMVWLGRKNCPPAEPLNHGVHDGDLESVLARTAPLPNSTTSSPYSWVEVTQDEPDAVPVMDQPASFTSRDRVHVQRWERRRIIPPVAPTITWETE
ncbi:type I-E CRISPR-associated protein Cas5/CasD [Streptosporangium sp. NPDC051022]|uniref:type I-E CRISPR-associated protein Cas5/CasD n=1 Tax=Streptosporangium sp. NPDC051022 TaxID=3155752 RepID=UPI003424C035